MKKLLVMLGLAAIVVSANASANPEFAKKCRTKVRHGHVKMKGQCDKVATDNQVPTPNNY